MSGPATFWKPMYVRRETFRGSIHPLRAWPVAVPTLYHMRVTVSWAGRGHTDARTVEIACDFSGGRS